MIIDSIHVKNFRSILNETLFCEPLTALVGANGVGKSSFLKALDLFYAPTPRIDKEDFYGNDATNEISIAITYKDLSDEAKSLFAKYIQTNKLTVERVFYWHDDSFTWKYHGATLRHAEFKSIRDGLELKDRGKTSKEAYSAIKLNTDYSSLPSWTNIGTASESLIQWEEDHPDKCIRQRDDGQFFGFKEVAEGYLGRFTRFIFISAVRDASEDTLEGRGSVLTSLMDMVVRSVLANKEALLKLKNDTQAQYLEILDPAKLTELTTLSDTLSNTLKTFVPDAKVDLRWLPLSEVDIPLPKADVKLVEDGYPSAVSRTGHGLQRAFILTLLQHLMLAQVSSTDGNASATIPQQPTPMATMPNLVLAIEEPELYQHPNRQRHLAKILLQLSNGKTPGVADRTQIIYATHSPLFVGIDRINQIRLLRKVFNENNKPKITKIISTDLDKVAEELWEADGKNGAKYTGSTLLPRLQTILTPWMNEGFFADVVILVEGEDDRAALLGMAKILNFDLESNGYSVIPCRGKTSIDRPAVIFRRLGIPVYLVWDSDKNEKDAKPEDNHRLLRLCGESIEDYPSRITDNFACFEENLERTICNEIGIDVFNRELNNCQNSFCIPKKKHALKNPLVISAIIQEAQKAGKCCSTLKLIIEKIMKKKQV